MVGAAKVRKFTVALAWCGVDGSLLAPVSLAATESWPCIEADLKPLLQKIKQTRLEAGFSLEESLLASTQLTLITSTGPRFPNSTERCPQLALLVVSHQGDGSSTVTQTQKGNP